MITILHISDLHRDAGSALTTGSLLESLRLDSERYGNQLGRPDVAIVSGDIVYGVASNDGHSDTALKAQYDEAHDFLARLSNLFFNGDHERVVLVPGNHDVSHAHLLRASQVEAIPTDPIKRAMVAKELASGGTVWRWDWSDFALRRVIDQELYSRRMEPYSAFYGSFYEGKRSFSLNVSEQYEVHDFPSLGIVVAALSSCFENDLFNRSGRIHPDCVAGATRAVSEPVRRGRIAIGTWHHNLAGGPRDFDYVDSDFLHSLIDGGFSIGLHGHQHRPQLLEHRFAVDRKRSITVVSAGTLCGGPRTLPPGRRRSYNLVRIDPAAMKGTVSIRETRNDGFSSPVWGDAHIAEFGGSTMEFGLSVRQLSDSAIQVAAEAAELLRKGDVSRALFLARSLPNEAIARRVAVEAFMQLDDWKGIKEFCTPPQSNTEIVALCEALYQLRDKLALGALLKSDQVSESTDLAVRQSVSQARARLGGGS